MNNSNSNSTMRAMASAAALSAMVDSRNDSMLIGATAKPKPNAPTTDEAILPGTKASPTITDHPLVNAYREVIRHTLGGDEKYIFALHNDVRVSMSTLYTLAINAGAVAARDAQQTVESQVLNSMMMATVRFTRYEHAAKLARDVINELAEAKCEASSQAIEAALAALENALNPSEITADEIAALTGVSRDDAEQVVSDNATDDAKANE